jgi:translation initiation factor 6
VIFLPSLRTSLYGNPNVGAFIFATDNFALVPPDSPQKFISEVSNTLKVPVYKTTICNSVLLGIFIVGNSNGILVPYNAKEEEISFIKEVVDLPVIQYNGKENALGNMILLNDKKAIVGPKTSEELKSILSNELKVEVFELSIAGISLPGVCAVINSKAILCHPHIMEEEKSKLEKIFNKSVYPSTVNRGFPYLRIGMVANSYGVVVGDMTTGLEIAHIEASLGVTE